MKEKTIEGILDKYSTKLIRIMRLEKDVEDAVIKSDLLQMEAAHEIKELIKAKLQTTKETLADIEHQRWSGWQEYLHSKCIKNPDGSLTIPAGYVFHLERLIKTLYKDLTEKEKDSDRAEVEKSLSDVIKIVEEL